MNPSIEKIAEGFDLVAEGLSELAHELRATASGAKPSPQMEQSATIEHFDREDFSVPGATTAPPRTRVGDPIRQEYGHEAVCPKHRIPYLNKGKGPFCSAKSDEPGWTSEKGYCQITPKSAAAWLAQHATGG